MASIFRGPDQLRRDDEKAWVSLQAIMEEDGTPEKMKARVIAYSRCLLEGDSFPLWVEAMLLACRDTAFQERISAFRHGKLDQVSVYIRTLSERDGGGPLPLQADALALGLASLCNGVLFFRMCDPRMVTDEVMQTALAGFLSFEFWRPPEEILYDDHRAGVPN